MPKLATKQSVRRTWPVREMGNGLSRMTDSLLGRLSENAGMQKAQLDSFAQQLMALTRLNEEKSETLRKSVDVPAEPHSR